MSGPVRYCGRDFPEAALDRIRALLAQRDPPLSRAALSRAVCTALDWRKPDGGLKQMSARVALLRMQRDGLLTLPPARGSRPRPRPLLPSPRTDPPALLPLPVSLAAARPLRLSLLRPADPRSRLWNEYVERYHYLGYKPLPGAQLRYFVHAADGQLLALLGCGAAAWKTAPRDRFVGWDPATRQRNLPLVVNHARYLILPWIRLPSLASPHWPPICWPASSDSSPPTGTSATQSNPSCSKPSAKPRASSAPATAPPTGSISARPKAAANSIPATSTTSPSKTSSSNPSAPTGKPSSIVSSAAVPHGPLERLQKGQSLRDLRKLYGTDQQCAQALFLARWPEGFRCKHQASLTAGTLCEHTKLPLSAWYQAMHLLTQSKNGISAMDLKGQLQHYLDGQAQTDTGDARAGASAVGARPARRPS